MYLLQHSAPTAAADDRRRARGKARAARAASLASCRGATWRHRHAPIAAQRRGEPLNHDTPPRPAAPRRRDLLALAAGAAAAAAPQPARAEAPPGTPVVPALTLPQVSGRATRGRGLRQTQGLYSTHSTHAHTPQYVAQIQIAAPQAWDEIESNLDAGRYRQQSLQLVLPPFDTVRQAAFFVPWVLLRADDERRATASQEAYLRLRVRRRRSRRHAL